MFCPIQKNTPAISAKSSCPHKIVQCIKITLFVTSILFSLLLLSSMIFGVFLIAGAHGLTIMSSFNTTISSLWKGLPYLITAMGGPGLLLFLGTLIFGVYLLCRNSQKPVPPIPELQPDDSSVVFHFKLEKFARNSALTITYSNGAKKIFTVEKYNPHHVEIESDDPLVYFDQDVQVIQNMKNQNAAFLYQASADYKREDETIQKNKFVLYFVHLDQIVFEQSDSIQKLRNLPTFLTNGYTLYTSIHDYLNLKNNTV